MEEAFRKHKVVPDVVDTISSGKLEASYSSSRAKVDFGNELTPTQVYSAPELDWKTEPDSLYVVSKVDPDAPSRKDPKAREWVHWLVGNVPGTEVGKGSEIISYVGAAPPKGSGLHRYVLLVYKQPKGKIKFTKTKIPNTKSAGRAKFSISKLAKNYELVGPVAGNFFQAQYDKTCDKIYQSFKK